jgi:hypothetical protein
MVETFTEILVNGIQYFGTREFVAAGLEVGAPTDVKVTCERSRVTRTKMGAAKQNLSVVVQKGVESRLLLITVEELLLVTPMKKASRAAATRGRIDREQAEVESAPSLGGRS